MSDTSQIAKVRFRVEGMDCASCATKIENALQRMPGVTDVAVSVAGGTVTVGHNAGGVNGDEIPGAGYRVWGTEWPSRSPSKTISMATAKEGQLRAQNPVPAFPTAPRPIAVGGGLGKACSPLHPAWRWPPRSRSAGLCWQQSIGRSCSRCWWASFPSDGVRSPQRGLVLHSRSRC